LYAGFYAGSSNAGQFRVKPHCGSIPEIKCKCRNKYTYIILCCSIKQCKKCDFYLRRGDFIMFLKISQLNGPLHKKPSKY